MTIICVIRYEIDPLQKDAFGQYARAWGRIIPRCAPARERVDGFISVERFQRLTRPGRYLSLSFWRDEEAVQRWRNEPAHRCGQQEGRSAVFADYRLRVATVVRDYGLLERAQAPADSAAALTQGGARRAACE